MPASRLEDVLSSLRRWKNEGNTLKILLVQQGHTNLQATAKVSAVSEDDAPEKEVVFLFGYSELAGGTLRIPLSSEFVKASVVDVSLPRLVNPIDPAFKDCIEVKWFKDGDFFIACVWR